MSATEAAGLETRRLAASETGAARSLRHVSQLTLRNVLRRRKRGDHTFELFIPEFNLMPGEFAALVGESGCGKSTFLDMLALVLGPTECSQFTFAVNATATQIEFDIQALWAAGNETQLAALRRRHLGYVLQTGGLFPFLTVRQNIALSLELNALSDNGRIDALADDIGLTDVLLQSKPQFLSGGQRQRAAILRGLVHQPGLILADEPTAAVDKPRARTIVANLQRIARANRTTVIMVTHDRDLTSEVDAVYGFDLESQENHVRSTCVRR